MNGITPERVALVMAINSLPKDATTSEIMSRARAFARFLGA